MYMLGYMYFGIFWLAFFLMAANDLVIIISTCTWYFSRKDIPDDDGIPGDSDIGKAFSWTFKYHIGSLALGSLLLALLSIISAIMEYASSKLYEKSEGSTIARCFAGCIGCCVDCFDRFMRFLNKNAFIYLAISNENFCSSSLNAFILVLKHAAKFQFVNTIGAVFMVVAKLCIAFGTVIICWFWILEVDAVESRTLPMLLIFGISYFVASVFVSIFEASSATILQCYLIDLDISKQSNLEPSHVPPTLQQHLGLMQQEEIEMAKR